MQFEIPKPILGEVTAITIASPDLDASFAWWQKLGFSEVMRMDFPFPWVEISDGALLIMLRKDPKPYMALTYYVKDIDGVVGKLETAGINFLQRPAATDFVKRYVFQSPDGLTISLVNIMDGFVQPPGPTMLYMQPQDYGNPDKYVNKVCGMYGELAEAVTDLDASILFWEKLGFKALSKFASPSPWAILSDGLAIVGLHQTTSFTQPAITFFAADMKAKLSNLKASGIKELEAAGDIANITLTTPEGQKVNLYSMGM